MVAGETFILRTYVNDRAYGDLCHMGENSFHEKEINGKFLLIFGTLQLLVHASMHVQLTEL